MKKFLIILIIVILLGAAGWFFFLRGDDDASDDQQAQKQDFPVQYDASATPTALTDYTSGLGGLSFQYPSNWNTVEGAENSAEKQLVTLESPMDTNEFYFCLDFNVLGAGVEGDLSATDSEVIASSELSPGRFAVVYKINDLDGLYWGINSSAVEVDANTFANEIAGESGARLQALGRFNCRETEKPDLTVDEFQNSQWLHEAQAVISSLKF